MEKMNMESADMVAQNVEKIAALFPNCVTETKDESGKLVKAINFETLRQMLSNVVDDGEEAYNFTWVGKKKALYEAFKPTRKTLRPCLEESVDWETTENLYIEGDNLEVLKLLKNSYMKKVKAIYIDPPYNTGSDFVYRDNFHKAENEWKEESGEYDDEGNRMVKNPLTNGRFHSDWCSMIYSRLLLARDLLTDDGVIFMSIDDNEVANLKKICDELFGADNFLAQVIWERAFSPINLKKHFSVSHDYILCYAKDLEQAVCNGLPRSSEANERYNNPDNDPRGPWSSADLSVGPVVESRVYEITVPSGRKVLPPNGYCWRLSKETFKSYVKDNRIWFGEGNNVPRIKRFLSEVKNGITPMTIWKYSDVGHSQEATKRLKELFDGKALFDYPKPVELIKRCIQLYSGPNDIILDFFSGSATTAHAVMQLNAEDGGNRKFIMVQLPEPCDKKSEAFKAGYSNICEVGKERIRRAGAKIKESAPVDKNNSDSLFSSDDSQTKAKLDTGFRVFKLDESNMEDRFYKPREYKKGQLQELIQNVKSDRTSLDLLFSCVLNWALPLSLSHTAKQIDGCTVHTYSAGKDIDLLACFDENIPNSVFLAIANLGPHRAVFLDKGFKDSAAKLNAQQTIEKMSPKTVIKTL